METQPEQPHIFNTKWITDFLFILGIFILFLLFCRFVWAPISALEHHVWARVLEFDKDQSGYVVVEFFWEGHTYQKSIDAHGKLKPGTAQNIQFFGSNPTNADWYSHGGGRGPYTTGGIFAFVVPFFMMIIIISLIWRKYFKGRKPLPFHNLKILASLIARGNIWLLNKTRVSIIWVFVWIFFGVFLIALIGIIGQSIAGVFRDPRQHPDTLAQAFLSAIKDRRINEACEAVYHDYRYDFLSNFHRWKLNKYTITGEPITTGTHKEYHKWGVHMSIGNEPDIWKVEFQHESVMDGKPMQGNATLNIIYLSSQGFCIKSGYILEQQQPVSNLDYPSSESVNKIAK
jgi:hypothetical protein